MHGEITVGKGNWKTSQKPCTPMNSQGRNCQETNKGQRHQTKLKEDQIKWQQKHRLIDSEKKRLKKFRRKTMFNAIFTCICCHRDLFECNVIKFSDNLLIQIESKKPGLYMRSIEMIENTEEESPIMVTINGVTSSYICHACKNHLKSGKLPPMSTMNGLKIHLQDPELELTELEANLIAKNIVFQNLHLRQLMNPEKCLKKAGNIHYQFYDDFNVYSARCRNDDFKGYCRAY